MVPRPPAPEQLEYSKWFSREVPPGSRAFSAPLSSCPSRALPSKHQANVFTSVFLVISQGQGDRVEDQEEKEGVLGGSWGISEGGDRRLGPLPRKRATKNTLFRLFLPVFHSPFSPASRDRSGMKAGFPGGPSSLLLGSLGQILKEVLDDEPNGGERSRRI